MKKILNLVLVFALTAFFAACSKDSVPTTAKLTVNLTGLEALGSGYVYEGWLIVDSKPVSTGTFTSVSFPQTYTVGVNDLTTATKFVLTIEPAGETGTAASTPSKTKILSGDFSGNAATVDSKEFVGDFSNSWGRFILATPTDGPNTNERSGVWFLTPAAVAGGKPTVGLGLPDLKDGWKYEGWAVIGGKAVTTGKFTKLAATDETAPFSGSIALPTPNGADGFFPGEDFLLNAPEGQTFPTDLRGATIVVTVEPEPDNSPDPFTLKPLAKKIADDAVDHAAISLGVGPKALLSGTVTR